MKTEELKERTKQFSVRAFRLIAAFPRTIEGRIIADQLGRCASSVGANYRAACRARSHAEFISRIGTVEEEADESCYWLELVIACGLLPTPKVEPLLQEARELTAIFTASGRTARANRSK
jgi:four helix bundle protein